VLKPESHAEEPVTLDKPAGKTQLTTVSLLSLLN